MRKVISKDGTAIAYDDHADEGAPLILVGGAMSYRSFPQYIELSGLLGKHFKVINYDRRGRGDSEDRQPYAVEREIEDIDALVSRAGGSAYAWGWSSGGALVLKAAAAGVNLGKIALYEPPYMVGTNGHRPPPDHQDQLKALIAAGRRDDAVKFFMRKMMGIPAPIVMAMRLFPFWTKLRGVAHTLPYDSAIMGDFTLPASVAAAVKVPALVMSGEKSPPVLREAAKALAAAMPNARLRVLEKQSHNISMKALAPVLIDFFE